MIKNLSQLKKHLQVGSKFEVVENILKPENNGDLREVSKVQSNAVSALKNDKDYWLYWQKAKNMRFNTDNTIDFLFGEMVKDQWAIEEASEQDKDYWLKIKVL